jgi:predicted TPR repeat methyltransferase
VGKGLLRGAVEMTPKLMSYNQHDFQSKAHMEMFISQIEKNVEAMQEQFREAGLLSFTVTQIWNKQGKFRVGNYWAYRDEKAFIDCQKLLSGVPEDEDNPQITNADRGVVRLQWRAGD